MEVLLLHIERRQLRWFENLTRTPSGCLIFIQGMPCTEDALRQNQDTLEITCLGCIGNVPVYTGRGGWESEGHSHLDCCMTRSQTTGRRWMDGLVK